MQPILDHTLLTAETALDTAGAFPASLHGQYIEATIYVGFDADSLAGAVVVETCHDPRFTGTWANIATVTWATADTMHYVSVTGIYRALRVRISSDVTSGTVDVRVSATT